MIQKEVRVRIGGLMRCCTGTLADYVIANPTAPVTEGQTLQCRHTSDPTHRMITRNAHWEWDHPAD